MTVLPMLPGALFLVPGVGTGDNPGLCDPDDDDAFADSLDSSCWMLGFLTFGFFFFFIETDRGMARTDL